MSDTAPNAVTNEVSLPQVPLYWPEFVWSLEKLRHRAYSRKMTESDWFRINPLEMVLLGCRTLYDHSVSSRDHGTFVMTMEDLSEKMLHRPRYWQRLITVLGQTISGKETPGAIVQRCAAGIINCWYGIAQYEELRPGFYSWCIVHFKLSELLDYLLTEKRKHLSPATNQDILDVSMAIQHMLSDALEIQTAAPLSLPQQHYPIDATPTLFDVFSSLSCIHSSEELPTLQNSTQSAFIVQLAALSDKSASRVLLPQVANEIVQLSLVFLNSATYSYNMKTLLDIAVLLSLSTVDDALFAQLLTEISDQLKKIPPELNFDYLMTVYVLLSSQSISSSLDVSIEFIKRYTDTLFTYSTEGYLSSNPIQFLRELFEFISSLSEQGVTPSEAIQVYLPNLFGQFFGVHDHTVSCRLLQYGYLSVCSQHRKVLLSDGLRYLAAVWRLFPPIDKALAQEKASAMHGRSLKICETILNEIIESLPINDHKLYESHDISHDESHDISHDESHDISHDESHDISHDESHGISHDESHDISHDESHDISHDESHDISHDESHDESDEEIELSKADRNHDNTLRISVLLHLLELACTMVRNGDNICFLYASIVPRLFSSAPPINVSEQSQRKLRNFFGEEPPPRDSAILWRVDKKLLAIHLFSLSTLSLENEMATPFQLCGIVVPKIAKNLDSLNFSDKEKLDVTIDILNITKETLQAGHNIEELISHGLELLSYLLPPTSSPDDLRVLINQLVQQLVSSGQTSLLFLIRNACVYLETHFPQELVDIQQLFRALVLKGKRNEIRCIFRVCRDPFNDQMYSKLRVHLYKFGQRKLTGKQLQVLCELVMNVMDITKTSPEKTISTDVEDLSNEEEKEEKRKEKERELKTVVKLVQPCMDDIDQALIAEKFDKGFCEMKQRELSRLTLFKSLFSEELSNYADNSCEELRTIFESKFPPEVLSSQQMMDLLSSCATRIEHIQLPRYTALKRLLTKLLKNYLSATVTLLLEVTNKQEELLSARENLLQNEIMSLTRNEEDFKKLTSSCEYSEQLWNEPFSLSVTTDGSHSLEENMRQALLACYREFYNILKEMGITHVSVNGELVKSSDLFSEELTLAELKGHRSVAVRTIDQKLGGTKEGRIHERKVALLSREFEIESDFEKQAKAPIKPKTFTVHLNISFFDCAKCCGPQIIGCYAPTGEHCERPLEIGLRVDNGFISLYDENGIELENCEIFLCEEGLYVYKAYTNGHPYDTSQVWIQVFTKLLEIPQGSSSFLVPAIIISKNFPNQRTWDQLRRAVQPEITGSILTCRPDFSPEWRSYFDYKPEKVRCGVDMILHPGFTLGGPSHRPIFMRQRSKVTKDLAGFIFDDIMTDLLSNEDLKQFRFLGKFISQYISTLIDTGDETVKIISDGFDYERWIKTQERRRDHHGHQGKKSKAEVVGHLVGFINEQVIRWCLEADVEEFCIQHHKQLLQLKSFLDRKVLKKDVDKNLVLSKLNDIKMVIVKCIYIVPIKSLPRATQEEIINWIFQNEDRVWRYRGGRCGHETLQQFMGFIGDSSHDNKTVYPGVAAFILPSGFRKDYQLHLEQDCRVDNVIGYSVGEIPNSTDGNIESHLTIPPNMSYYEIALGWVSPKYQKLRISLHMYFSIIRQVPSRYIVCDVVQGSVERIISSNPLLRFLRWMKLAKYIIWRRQGSYSVQLETGHTEQFEQVVFLVWPLRVSLWLYGVMGRILQWNILHPQSIAISI